MRIRVPYRPWSSGSSVWSALLSCWCSRWSSCHRSPKRLVATLPKRLRSSCRRDLGSSFESHKCWAWICWFDQKKIRDAFSFDFQNFVLDLNSADVAFGKYAMWSQSVEQCNKIMTSSRNDTDVTCLQIFLQEFLEIIVPQLELSHANHFAIFETVVLGHFYRTRVRSLAKFVTHSLTDWLTSI